MAKKKMVLNSQTREFVLRLRDYFIKEAKNGGPLLPVKQVINRVADALDINRTTVLRISKEKATGNWMDESGVKRNRVPPVVNMDCLDVDGIRNHIHAYYRRKEVPTRASLVISLKAAGLFKGGKSSLAKILNNIGFVSKRKDKKRCLLEKRDVVVARSEFQLEAKRIPDWNNVVFLDQASVNVNHTNSTDTTVKIAPNKVRQINIYCAISSKGLIPNSLVVAPAKKTLCDCMEPEGYMEWFKNIVNELCTPTTIIIESNTSNSEKVHDNVEGRLCGYVVDEMAAEQGHKVLRVPLLHREYNAVKLIWPEIKEYIAEHNTEPFSGEKMISLVKNAFKQQTSDKIKDAVDNTKTVILGVTSKDMTMLSYQYVVDVNMDIPSNCSNSNTIESHISSSNILTNNVSISNLSSNNSINNICTSNISRSNASGNILTNTMGNILINNNFTNNISRSNILTNNVSSSNVSQVTMQLPEIQTSMPQLQNSMPLNNNIPHYGHPYSNHMPMNSEASSMPFWHGQSLGLGM